MKDARRHPPPAYFFIPHPSSIIPHPSSLIPHPSSLIPHPSSLIPHPSSLIPHPSSLMLIRVGNGAGFLGDNLDAPRRLVESAQLDYLTLEYLAELTLSILARLRERSPAAGYAEDFLTALSSLLPAIKKQPGLKIVTNAGGMNPLACAQAAGRVLAEAGLGELAI